MRIMVERNATAEVAMKPAIPQMSLHLGFALNRVAQQMRERFEQALLPLGIKPRHYGALRVISEAGPMPQNAIGEILDCDRNMMVSIVDDLEKLELARRDVHPQDRRAYAVCLTPAGRRLLEKANAIALSVESQFLAPLSTKQRRQLHELLGALVQAPQQQ
jgi:DNA-binding MarR family transcriptional regulator